VRHPATGAPLFTDPVSATVAGRCVPDSVAARLQDSEAHHRLNWTAWMAARTAEVDRQALAAAAAVAAAGAPRLQVVILGERVGVGVGAGGGRAGPGGECLCSRVCGLLRVCWVALH
jgi:hypothetical protein